MKTINSTGRVIDPIKDYCCAVKKAVSDYDRKKEWHKNNKRGFKGIWNLSYCSLCKKGMRKDLAKAQIENKRENAPICMACIMGYTRVEKPQHKWKDETIKKFQEI